MILSKSVALSLTNHHKVILFSGKVLDKIGDACDKSLDDVNE